jgi:hypothetical protein
MIFRVILIFVASIAVASAQEESGISFDAREVPDWTELLGMTGLSIALGGGVGLFALRSWLWPRLRPWFVTPAFRYVWPSSMVALGVTAAFLESQGYLNATVENVLAGFAVVLFPLNLPGISASAGAIAICEALALDFPRLPVLGLAVFVILDRGIPLLWMASPSHFGLGANSARNSLGCIPGNPPIVG